MESKGGADAAVNPLAGPVIHFSGLNMEKDSGAAAAKPNLPALFIRQKGGTTTNFVCSLSK